MVTKVVGLASALLLLAGCAGGEFTRTGSVGGAGRRPLGSVAIMTERPPPGTSVEVGLISAHGSSFEDALYEARQQGAEHGCDAILVLGEAVQGGAGVPGGAWGATRSHLRCPA